MIAGHQEITEVSCSVCSHVATGDYVVGHISG